MKAKWFSAFLVFAMLMVALVPTASAAGNSHKWKFSPTINAPWAREGDQEDINSPISAAGLCRSNPFDTLFAYGSLGTNVDAIVGDPTNNSGFSNFGCATPQNETTIAVNPTNPNNLIAGANVTLSAVDDSIDDEVDLTVEAWEPVTNGDAGSPEIVFDDGDVVMDRS